MYAPDDVLWRYVSALMVIPWAALYSKLGTATKWLPKIGTISCTFMTGWSVHFSRHKGRWVAFADDERTMIRSGESAREACEAALPRQLCSSSRVHSPLAF